MKQNKSNILDKLIGLLAISAFIGFICFLICHYVKRLYNGESLKAFEIVAIAIILLAILVNGSDVLRKRKNSKTQEEIKKKQTTSPSNEQTLTKVEITTASIKNNNPLIAEARAYVNSVYSFVLYQESYEKDSVRVRVPDSSAVYYQEALKPDKDIFENMEPTFSQMLFKFIKQQGISETECYKNANIDRRLFSKIRSDDNYKPKKDTVLAIIIGLKLNLDDAETLLECAGYSLSHSIRRDVVMEFIIKKQIYDINVVNEILYSLDCRTLGSRE